jgi:hypothetical protein
LSELLILREVKMKPIGLWFDETPFVKCFEVVEEIIPSPHTSDLSIKEVKAWRYPSRFKLSEMSSKDQSPAAQAVFHQNRKTHR